MIDSMRETFSAKELCEAFEVSPSKLLCLEAGKANQTLGGREKNPRSNQRHPFTSPHEVLWQSKNDRRT